jgi:hypothetical protein
MALPDAMLCSFTLFIMDELLRIGVGLPQGDRNYYLIS